jgi:hypothetical protein
MKITRDMVSVAELHSFYSDASDLGFAVGSWPKSVSTDMGNGLPFLLWSVSDECAIYRQSNGVIVLRVFND